MPDPIPGLPAPVPVYDAALPPSYERDGVRVLPGVAYADLPGARPLELDLYLPEASESHTVPVVLFFHGGGWRMGSRHTVGPMFGANNPGPMRRLAQAGIAVAAVDYRLSGEATWPAQLHDARAAVRWLRHRSAELRIAPDRIGAWGESAGGHLAAMLGLTTGRLAEQPGTEIGVPAGSSGVTAVCAWYPPTDLAAIAPARGVDPSATDSREALLLGQPVDADPELAAAASPVSYVAADAPSFLVLHGESDDMIPVDQSRALVVRLRGVGAEAELVTYPGANHMWLGAPEAARDASERTVAFFSRILRRR